MSTAQGKGKYYLRSLHQEIDLYDRKLAHLLKYDQFGSDKARDIAAGKLSTKRDVMVHNARQLVEEGVEYELSELPRSLRQPGQVRTDKHEELLTKSISVDASHQQEQTAIPADQFSIVSFRKEVETLVRKPRRSENRTQL